MTTALGIDIGGSGIKGAPVNTHTGETLADRVRFETPAPATPDAMIDIVREIIRHFEWAGPVGIGFPGVVHSGIVKTAANLDPSWLGRKPAKEITKSTTCPAVLINDADAAGVAEMRFGAARGNAEVVLLVTVGTGIGSALFSRGILVPNTELGHAWLANGKYCEQFAADIVRKEKGLEWSEWSERFSIVLNEFEKLFSPDLIILGGGISKKLEKFEQYLTVETKVVPAELRNMAGIVGAATHAVEVIAASSSTT